jgi:F0F1-type ATP synthase assembly protein I
MGLSADLVVTTLVGLGLGWLVGGIGARPAFVVVGGLLGGAAGVNTVERTSALLGYGACNPSGAAPNGRQGTW